MHLIQDYNDKPLSLSGQGLMLAAYDPSPACQYQQKILERHMCSTCSLVGFSEKGILAQLKHATFHGQYFKCDEDTDTV